MNIFSFVLKNRLLIPSTIDSGIVSSPKYEFSYPGVVGFPGGDSDKEVACLCSMHKRHEFNPWVKTWPGRTCLLEADMALPLQYSCLENPMNRGAWWDTVLGVTKSRTQLSNLAYSTHFLGTVNLQVLPGEWEKAHVFYPFKAANQGKKYHMVKLPY